MEAHAGISDEAHEEVEALTTVMPGFMPGIHAFTTLQRQKRGWPEHRRAKARRPLDGYIPP
jgi:hypothetical protein